MSYDESHQQILDIAVQTLKDALPGLVAVIQFGSFGSIYEKNESDLDLAILTRDTHVPIDPVKLWNIAQEIAGKINRDVDLIDLSQASTVFRYQILKNGQTIYCRDKLILTHFDSLSVSMYLRFQEERKEILEDYEKGLFHAG